MIRLATVDDEDQLIELALAFNAAYFDIPVVPEKLDAWITTHMQHGVTYLSEDGFISGLIVPDPLRDHTVLLETGWFSRDNQGARLLLKFIATGREYADEVRMTTLSNSPPEAAYILDRLGFKEIERSWRLMT